MGDRFRQTQEALQVQLPFQVEAQTLDLNPLSGGIVDKADNQTRSQAHAARLQRRSVRHCYQGVRGAHLLMIKIEQSN